MTSVVVTNDTSYITTSPTSTYIVTDQSSSKTIVTGQMGPPGPIGSSGGAAVTSVGITVPTGLTVSGSPVTSSGVLAISFGVGYSIPTIASQNNWNTAYTDRNKWDGGAVGLSAATGRESLGATTLGSNLFTLNNPSTVSFLRINADNTVSTLDATTFRSAIGAQPVGSYLTAESDTLATVTARGATTSAALSITNTTSSSSKTTGALLVTGGVGIGGNLNVGSNLTIAGNLVVTGTLTTSISLQPTLVSGTNIKTVNSTSLLGSGDITITIDGYADSITAGVVPVATGANSIALGSAARAAGANSFAAFTGSNTVYGATGDASIAIGNASEAAGAYSLAFGHSCYAAGEHSIAIGAYASSLTIGKLAYSGFNNFGQGAAQTGMYILCGTTTGPSASTRLQTNQDALPNINNQITLPDKATFGFKCLVVARQQSGVSGTWEVRGIIRRETGSGTTTIVGVPIIDVISEPSTTWKVTVTADTTLGSLNITAYSSVTAGTSVRWVAYVQTSELVY